MKTFFYIFLFAGIIGFGVYYVTTSLKDKVASSAIAGYKNATYIIDGREVTLVNGFAEEHLTPGSASKITTRYFGNEVQADLNGDGETDAALLLTQSGDGSGTFYYLVAAIKSDKGYRGSNAVYIGDRIAPQTTEYRGGEIIVNYADHGPKQAMTDQPNLGASRYFKFQNNTLFQVIR